jgi:hypothetical protein
MNRRFFLISIDKLNSGLNKKRKILNLIAHEETYISKLEVIYKQDSSFNKKNKVIGE